ncbi:metallophosphoesterase [Vallitalea pronyensis]|uniref:Metallophosphoesterase n=1 Tax=Vallitalea pronyensis TaxID=1348613 RepID=A0A8J8MM02_9FIRM|nr:metallophosphoesterase [Vallitalea pronyensis]QUI24215.1 metallophosphoesterase [Vallitalea pronyensis]
MTRINWIHISDIHYNFDNYNTTVMREKTIDYLKSIEQSYNFIVITGDIRYRGEPYTDELIEFISNILNELKISNTNLFIVPGNHDVKRSQKRKILINGICSLENPSDEVDTLDTEIYNDLLSGQDEYFNFYNKLMGHGYKQEELHYVACRENYNIIHINTCLISGIDGEDSHKKLIIGQKKLRNALKNINNENLNVAVGHHSIECLAIEEQKRFENNLSDHNIDMYLSGHVHKPRATFNVNNENDLLYVSCGSGMCDSYSTVGIVTGSLDIETGNGQITFHKWSQSLGKWVEDNEVSRRASGNSLEISINRLLKNNVKKNAECIKSTNINLANTDVNNIISQYLKSSTDYKELTIKNSKRNIHIDIPIISTKISTRQDNVNDLIGILKEKTWIHLHGDIWSGKTYLATLVAQKWKNNTLWITLKGFNSKQAYNNIYELLISLTGVPSSHHLEHFCKNVCEQINEHTLIIFDDVPMLLSNLRELFLRFVLQCKKRNIKIISTGIEDIPLNVRQSIGEETLALDIPKFSNYEINDLLKVYKAPEEIITNEKFTDFIAVKTKGNPSLIGALIYYLSINEWQFTNEILMDIINDRYSLNLESEIQDIVIKTLNNPQERELLYRLSTIGWAFTFNDVRIICNILPIIELPLENFNKLINIWVKEENNKFIVSPLIKKIAEKNITLTTKRSLNLSMANELMKKETLTPLEILRAITHFIDAEKFDDAGYVLIKTLNEMDSRNLITDEWGFAGIWYNISLPPQMNIETKLYLRVIQIKFCIRIGKDIKKLLEDFDNLINELSIPHITFYMSTILALTKPQKANKYLLNSIDSLSDMQLPNGEPVLLPETIKPESIIWLTGASIKSYKDIRNWIDTLSSLSHDQLKIAFSDTLAEQCCFSIIDNIWLIEYKKEKQEWKLLMDYFIELTYFAYQRNLEILWACAIRGRIIILAENQQNLNEAIKLANASLKLASNNPIIQFIIKSITGKQLVYKGKYTDAIKWLKDALSNNINLYLFEKVDTYLKLSEAIAFNDLEESAQYAKQAVEISKSNQSIPKYYLVKVIGECIIALWEAKNVEDMFLYYDEAVNILLGNKKDSNSWKEVFTIFGHVSGYIIILLQTGSAPDKTKDGTPYKRPYRRMFLNDSPLLAEQYDQSMDYVLAIHTYWFAEKIGEYDKAEEWAISAYDMGMKSHNKHILIADGYRLGSYLINRNMYRDALVIQLDCIINLVRNNVGNSNEKGDNTEFVTYKNEILNSTKLEAEKKMIIYWAIPSFMKVSTIHFLDAKLAQDYAHEIIDICNQAKETYSNQELWDNIMNLFVSVFNTKKDFNNFSNEYSHIINSQDTWLKALYYIGASTLCNDPNHSIKIQLLCAPLINNQYIGFPPMFKMIVGDYFKLFWLNFLSIHKSKFIGWNRTIKSQIDRCYFLSDDVAIKKILGVISVNLDIDLGEDIMNWLEI